MATPQDKFTVHFGQNPAVAESVTEKEIKTGDELEWKIKCKVLDVRPDAIDLQLMVIYPENYEEAKDEKDLIVPPLPPGGSEAPIPTAESMMIRRKP